MKPFNENDLVAYHLKELSPRRARALEKALRAEPFLAAESEAYATMLRSFKGGIPLNINEEIIERNWSSLSSKLPRQPLRTAVFPRWLIPVLTGGFAFAAATSFFITSHRRAAPPSAASVDRPSEMPQSMPSAGKPFETDAMTQNPDDDHPGVNKGWLHPAMPGRSPSIIQPHHAPPRILASVSRGSAEPEPLVQFSPPIRNPAPLPPVLTNPPLISVQTNNPSQPKPNDVRRNHAMDLTLAMGGTLIGIRDASSNGALHTQGASPAVSAIASFHQQLRPAIGYRVTVSYTRPDFFYNEPYGDYFINGRTYEVAGTYVLQGPHRGIVSTAVEAGAGLMAMLPTNQRAEVGNNLRAAAIVGASAEFAVSKHLAIHAAYRMQVFNGPDFQYTGDSSRIVTSTLISNEPMLGITYRFSHK